MMDTVISFVELVGFTLPLMLVCLIVAYWVKREPRRGFIIVTIVLVANVIVYTYVLINNLPIQLSFDSLAPFDKWSLPAAQIGLMLVDWVMLFITTCFAWVIFGPVPFLERKSPVA